MKPHGRLPTGSKVPLAWIEAKLCDSERSYATSFRLPWVCRAVRGFVTVAFLFATALQSSFALEITSPEYAGGAKNRPFNYLITSSPSTFSYGATNLPNGLSLHPIGEISGTPLETGVYSATIKATRSGTTVSKLLTIEINNGRPGDFDLSFGVAAATGSSSQISVMARQPDGKLIIGGAFAQYAGVDRTGIARLNVDGSLDLGFNPVLTNAGSPGSVGVIAVQEDGEMMVIAGNFTEVNGAPRNHFARLESDGSLDPTFNPTAGTDGGINAFALQSDGKLIVGGAFGSINGQSRNGLARLQTDGMLDTTFQPNPAGYVNVYSLAIQPDHKVIVAGETDYFSGIPGTVLEKGITRLNEDGSLDGSFNPGLGLDGVVLCLALQRDGKVLAAGLVNTFNGAPKLGLLRLKTDGSLDQNYIPDFSGFEFVYIYALALQPDGKAIIGGSGETFSQQSYRIFRRLTANGTADSNTFSPSLSSDDSVSVLSLAPDGAITAGGNFAQAGFRPAGTIVRFHGGPVVLHSPTIAVDSPNGTFAATPDVQDTGAVTHFRIVDLTGATVFLPGNPSIPLKVGDFITVAQAAPPEGLSYFVAPGATASTIQLAAATGPSLAETGLATSTVSFLPQIGPVKFHFEVDYPIAHEHDGVMIARVIKSGGDGSASSQWSVDLDIEAPASNSSYEIPSQTTLTFTNADLEKCFVIPLVDNAEERGDEIILKLPPGGLTNGATLADQDVDYGANEGSRVDGGGTARAYLYDNDAPDGLPQFSTVPDFPPLPAAEAQLEVQLYPVGANGGWRFSTESAWRAGATVATGLVDGAPYIANNDLPPAYFLEFKPVPGYETPKPARIIARKPEDPLYAPFVAIYRPMATGSLHVDVVFASGSGVGEWRRRGETAWRPAGSTEAGIPPGQWVVEFKPLADFATPPPRAVQVNELGTTATTGSYRLAPFPGTPALPTPLESYGPTVPDTDREVLSDPYWFVGQIRTEGGTATGTVVGGGYVVLTAAHALFDEVNLRYWTQIEWRLHQHGTQEATVAQTARGFHVYGRGYSRQYAAQRKAEATPGVPSLDSDDLDVAALYFFDPVGRGGCAGHVSSNVETNTWLVGARDRVLIGYPTEDANGEIIGANENKMYATPISSDYGFTARSPRVFGTTALRGFRGMDGAPIFAKANDQFYVAGIFLRSEGETRVRAVDQGVAELITRAQQWGETNGGAQGNSNQPTAVKTTQVSAGILEFSIPPAIGGWRFVEAPPDVFNLFTNPVQMGAQPVTLAFMPVAGKLTPSSLSVEYDPTMGYEATVNYLTATYLNWRDANFPDEANDQIRGAFSDPDTDGARNSFEYAFNLLPKTIDARIMPADTGVAGLPVVALDVTGTPVTKRLTIQFLRRRQVDVSELDYFPEFSSNLNGPWEAGMFDYADLADDYGVWARETWYDPQPASNNTSRFARVRVYVKPPTP